MKQVQNLLDWLKIQKVELSGFNVNSKKSIEEDGLIAIMPVGFVKVIQEQVNAKLLELQSKGICVYEYFVLPKNKIYKIGVIYKALRDWDQVGVNPLIIDTAIEVLKNRFSENPNERFERIKKEIQNLTLDNNEKIGNI